MFSISLSNPNFQRYMTVGVTGKSLLWSRVLFEKLRFLVSKQTYRIYGHTKLISRSQQRLALLYSKSYKSSLDPPILFLRSSLTLSPHPRLDFPRYVQPSILTFRVLFM